MKKRKVIVAVVAIVIGLLALGGYFVVDHLQQEELLKKETDTIVKLTEKKERDTEKIEKYLDRTVTKGEYSKIEKAAKEYIRVSLDAEKTAEEIENNETIINAVSIENFQNDGPDFEKTIPVLKDVQEKITGAKEALMALGDKDKTMSYLKGVKNSYYKDLYYKEIIGTDNLKSELQEMEKAVDNCVELMKAQQNILEFLAENKNVWTIQNGVMEFENEDWLNRYNELFAPVLQNEDKN